MARRNPQAPAPQAPAPGVEVAAYDAKHHGFLQITATATKISGEYFTVQEEPNRINEGPMVTDRFEVDLATKPLATSHH
jgi:hypothetical protein